MTSVAPVDVNESHAVSEPANEVAASGVPEPSHCQFQRMHCVLITVVLVLLGAVAGVAVWIFLFTPAFLCHAETRDEVQTGVIDIVTEQAAATTIAAVRTTEQPTTSAVTTTAVVNPTTPAPPPTTTAMETTTPTIPPELPANCSVVCEGVMGGSIPDQPIGLATHGAARRIYPDFAADGLLVYCDCTNVTEGAWTVFQRRMDGSVDFYRNWANYTEGFGNVTGEFWLGLDVLHNFTRDGGQDFKFDLEDWEGERAHSNHRGFSVDGPETNYTLNRGQFWSDTAVSSDSVEIHHGHQFSTYDRTPHSNIAVLYHGAWWFRPTDYMSSHLNGRYHQKGEQVTDPPLGVTWKSWKPGNYSLKAAEIKFRPSP